MNHRLVTLISGLGLLLPASMGLFFTGYPTILHPLPALTVLPALVLSSAHLWIAGAIVPVVGFFTWNPGLMHGQPKVPQRTYVLFLIAIALSTVWFVAGWTDGLEYQGPSYVRGICIVNFAWILALGLLFGRAWKAHPSFRANLLLHWVLFAWFAWVAFPYLGELP